MAKRLTRSSGGTGQDTNIELLDQVMNRKKSKAKAKPKPKAKAEAEASSGKEEKKQQQPAESKAAGTKRKADKPEDEPAAKKPRVQIAMMQPAPEQKAPELPAAVARDMEQQFGAGSAEYKAAPGNEFRIFGAPKCIEELRTHLREALNNVMGPGARLDVEASVIFDLMHISGAFNGMQDKVVKLEQKLEEQKPDFKIVEEKVAELGKENERFFNEITQLRRILAANFQPRVDDRIPLFAKDVSNRRHQLKPGDYILPRNLFKNSRPAPEGDGLLELSIGRFVAEHEICDRCWTLEHGFSDNLEEEHKGTCKPSRVTLVETLSGKLVVWADADIFHADLITSGQCYQLTNHAGWLAQGDRSQNNPIVRAALGKDRMWMLDSEFSALQRVTDLECKAWGADAIKRHMLTEILKKPYALTREEYRRQLSLRAKEPAVFVHRNWVTPAP